MPADLEEGLRSAGRPIIARSLIGPTDSCGDYGADVSHHAFVAVVPDDLTAATGPQRLDTDFLVEAIRKRWPDATIAPGDGHGSRLELSLTEGDDISVGADDDCFSFRKPDPQSLLDLAVWLRALVPDDLAVAAFDDQGSYAPIPPGSGRDATATILRDAHIV